MRITICPVDAQSGLTDTEELIFTSWPAATLKVGCAEAAPDQTNE
jgi:hypothetical protein